MTSRLPLRPPTVYGAAHETARAEGHPGHRASRPSRGGGARRLAHAGHVEKTDRLRCPSVRSEEHTSELQSPVHLVCRLLLEKKKKKNRRTSRDYGRLCSTYQHPQLP